MADAARQRLTYTDYLALEARSDEKHEWLDGQVVAMAGGKPVHAQLSAQAIVALSAALGPRGCTVYSSDLRVRMPDSGLATYPDVTVVCGDLETHPEDDDAATNPVMLVEILSPSTEGWDRGGKRTHYQTLPSLKAVVLVNTDWQCLELYERAVDGWHYRMACAGQTLRVEALDLSLDVDTLYARTGITTEGPPLMVREPEPSYGAPRAALDA